MEFVAAPVAGTHVRRGVACSDPPTPSLGLARLPQQALPGCGAKLHLSLRCVEAALGRPSECREAFVAALDAFFDQGGYTQANEPDLLVPWLYAYAGRPDRIADRVWGILDRSYAATRKGLPGNDDAGTMSAWYVFAALGLYPNAGQDVYLLGSPRFSRAELAVGGGKHLVITAQGVSPRNRYVQSLTLDGQPWDRCWLRHRDIANGGDLTFVMGPQPSSWATLATPPPSQSSP